MDSTMAPLPTPQGHDHHPQRQVGQRVGGIRGRMARRSTQPPRQAASRHTHAQDRGGCRGQQGHQQRKAQGLGGTDPRVPAQLVGAERMLCRGSLEHRTQIDGAWIKGLQPGDQRRVEQAPNRATPAASERGLNVDAPADLGQYVDRIGEGRPGENRGTGQRGDSRQQREIPGHRGGQQLPRPTGPGEHRFNQQGPR